MPGYFIHFKKDFTGRFGGIDFKNGMSIKKHDRDYVMRYQRLLSLGCKFIEEAHESQKHETKNSLSTCALCS